MVGGNRVHLQSGEGSSVKKPGSVACWNHPQLRHKCGQRKMISAAGWNVRSCHRLELSLALAGTASEIRISCCYEWNPQRTGAAVSLTCVLFMQDQNEGDRRKLDVCAPGCKMVPG